jgi:hypothetical protein
MAQSSFGGFVSNRPPKIGGSSIKSIQSGTATIGAATTNVTIANVDTGKAIVIFTAVANSGSTSIDQADEFYPSGAITTATNLQFIVNTYVQNITVEWQVIEFENVKSLQKGSAAITGVGVISVNVALSAVAIAKCIVLTSYSTAIGSSIDYRRRVVGKLTTTTNLNLFLTSNADGAVSNIQYQVIEFF